MLVLSNSFIRDKYSSPANGQHALYKDNLSVIELDNKKKSWTTTVHEPRKIDIID